MSPESKKISLRKSDGETLNGEILYWEVSPDNEDEVKIILIYDGVTIEKTSDSSLFDALRKIREELENKHLLICCYGAGMNIYPSPMIESMGGGRKAYRLSEGEQAKNDDLVDIFDFDPSVFLATVNEQKEFYFKWINSLARK